MRDVCRDRNTDRNMVSDYVDCETRLLEGKPDRFITTQWSVVLAAGADGGSQAETALASLCGLYWKPLYAYVRRSGFNVEEAEDLTQGFFEQFFAKEYLKQVDPQKGRFRSFLVASIKHYISNERDRKRAQKRGGKAVHISLDFEDAERLYASEPQDGLSPDQIYERQWVANLLRMVFDELQKQYAKTGEEALFVALQPFLTFEEPRPSYREVAESLNKSESAVKSAIYRLRKQFGKALRRRVQQTLPQDEDVDLEVKQLLRVFS